MIVDGFATNTHNPPHMHRDATQLEFLARLGKSPDGQQLLMLIKAEVDDVNAQLRTQTGDFLVRAQGKAVFLDELAGLLNPRPKSAPRDLSRRSFQSLPDSFA